MKCPIFRDCSVWWFWTYMRHPFMLWWSFGLSFLFQSTSTYCVYVLKWSVSTLDSITGGAGIGNPMVLVQVRGEFLEGGGGVSLPTLTTDLCQLAFSKSWMLNNLRGVTIWGLFLGEGHGHVGFDSKGWGVCQGKNDFRAWLIKYLTGGPAA